MRIEINRGVKQGSRQAIHIGGWPLKRQGMGKVAGVICSKVQLNGFPFAMPMRSQRIPQKTYRQLQTFHSKQLIESG